MPTANQLSRLVLAMTALLAASGLYFAFVSVAAHSPASASSDTDGAVLLAMAVPETIPGLPAPAVPERQQLPQMDLMMSLDIFSPALEPALETSQADEPEQQAEEVEAAPSPNLPPPPPVPVVAAAPRQAPPPPPAPAPTKAPAPPPPAAVGLSALEQQLFDGQNAERGRAGLTALRLDAGLESVARWRAQDMATRGYFSHTSPTGETAFTLIDAAGISAPYAAENIGYNNYADSTSAYSVLAAFMSSPGHRANILNAVYTRVGVAVAYSSSGMKYYAIVFAGP